MKVSVDLNNPFLIKAKNLSRIKSDKVIIEKALQLFVIIKTKEKLKVYREDGM